MFNTKEWNARNKKRVADRARRASQSSEASVGPVHAASAPLDPHSGPGDASLSHPFVGVSSR